MKRANSSSKPRTPSKSPSKTPSVLTEFISNENDGIDELKVKNAKLRQLVVQASSKIAEMSKKYSQMENDYKIEKATILSELDRISKNYQIYAESHKQFAQFKNEYQLLLRERTQNNKVLVNYTETIKSLLSDMMNMYCDMGQYEDDHYINCFRNKIRENVVKYNNEVDTVNFGGFYNLYNDFIRKSAICQEQINSSQNKKKRKYSVRKKEYIGIDNISNSSNVSTNNAIDNNPSGHSKYRFNKSLINDCHKENSSSQMNYIEGKSN